MLYYRHEETGQVYAYESASEKEEFGPEMLVEMTLSEVEAHLNPPEPEPEPPKVTEITQRQCRLQLLNLGLLDNVDGYIDSLPPEQAAAARIEWEYADVIKRDNPLVLALIQALDLTEEQADEWFNEAGRIV